jgi:adenylate cyclase, class 2
MPIETEKKYRLTKNQRTKILQRLPEIGAKRTAGEFEENTIYMGRNLAAGTQVLRLRVVGDSATLAFKQRLPGTSPIKHQREEETRVDDPRAMRAILEALGFTPALVYEKRRETWLLGQTEIVIDELPFGLFMEIEGEEIEIETIESKLAIRGLTTENATYPQLTMEKGTRAGSVVEARFQSD